MGACPASRPREAPFVWRPVYRRRCFAPGLSEVCVIFFFPFFCPSPGSPSAGDRSLNGTHQFRRTHANEQFAFELYLAGHEGTDFRMLLVAFVVRSTSLHLSRTRFSVYCGGPITRTVAHASRTGACSYYVLRQGLPSSIGYLSLSGSPGLKRGS